MKWFRRIFSLVTLGIVIYLFVPFVGEIRQIGGLLQNARWEWLAAAFLLQFGSYAFLALLNISILKPFVGSIRFLDMTAILTSLSFINTALPSGGASGLTLRARLLARYGYFTEASAFSLFLETILLAFSTACTAMVGVIYLVQNAEISISSLWKLALLILLVLVLSAGGWRFIRNYQNTSWMMRRFTHIWNKLLGKYRQFDADTLEIRLVAFHGDMEKITGTSLLLFLTCAFGRILLDIATMGAFFYLFGYPINAGQLITGYALVLLLTMVSAIPGGLGLADASAPALFARMGVPAPLAFAAGLGYRLLSFWLLRFIGYINWQILENGNKKKCMSK